MQGIGIIYFIQEYNLNWLILLSWADGILYTILDLFQRIDDKGKQISVPNWDTKSLLEILLGINKDELPEGVFDPSHGTLENAYMADKIL